MELALQLYYALKEPGMPLWAKTVIVGALGYFISPVGAIPVVGYSDDLGVLLAAVVTVASCITDEIKAKAETQAFRWLG